MINISWLPYWSPIEDYASSRLRCLFHHENLNKYHSENFRSTIGFNPDLADKNIIIITQRVKEDDILKIVDFKNKSKDNIVIYDIVDTHYQNEKSDAFKLCDFVIVANDLQRVLISKHTDKRVFVLPDCIDYPNQINSSIVPFNNNIVWFGNNNGLNNIKNLLLYTLENKYNVNIIGQCKFYGKLIPGSKCIEWEYDNFIKNLRNNSIALLTHDLKQQQKSNNKLLVCIANGIPVISYQSKSYEELLRKFNLNHAIINNQQDLLNAIKILSREDNRLKYFEKLQPYILENYNSQNITKKLIDIIDLFDKPINQNKSIIFKSNNILPLSLRTNPLNKKILLYTTNINSYDNFTDIEKPFTDYIDYLYITDKSPIFRNWKVKKINSTDQDPYMLSKMYKILPHRFFPEYEISIWIDASAINIHGQFHNLISEFMRNYNFLICKHPTRKCVYEEAIACLRTKRDKIERITKQINRYKDECYPSKNGLYSCGFLVRKHNEIKEFSEAWWEEIINNCRRDQISFPYMYNKYKELIKLKVFEHIEHQKFFDWRRHGKGPLIPNQNQILHRKNQVQAWGRKKFENH